MPKKYYGIDRSEDYIEHHGVRGMRWGHKKAYYKDPRDKTRALMESHSEAFQKAREKAIKLKNDSLAASVPKASASKYGAFSSPNAVAPVHTQRRLRPLPTPENVEEDYDEDDPKAKLNKKKKKHNKMVKDLASKLGY